MEDHSTNIINIAPPRRVLAHLQKVATYNNASVNCCQVAAIIRTHADDLPEDVVSAWSIENNARADSQCAAVDALRDALADKWLSEDDFRFALGLTPYEFMALAHVLSGVADINEQQALPPALRLVVEMAKSHK